MKFGVFEIVTRYEDNGVFGDGYASWPVGTSIELVQTFPAFAESLPSEVRAYCKEISEKNPGRVYFYAEVFQH